MTRIFCIGLVKCGSVSLHRFFQDAGMAAVHWDGGRLGARMTQRLWAGEDPVADYPDTIAFTDFWPAAGLFEGIYRHHPDALYILNTRSLHAWIRSRLNHVGASTGSMAEFDRDKYRVSADGLLDLWRAQYIAHHAEVRAFFRRKPNFLAFNIERRDPAELQEFIGTAFPGATQATFGKHNSTEERQANPAAFT